MDVDAEITVNLVDVTACSPTLLQAVEREGIPV